MRIKRLVLGLGILTVIVFVSIAFIPSMRARLSFWLEYSRLPREFEGIDRFEDKQGKIWHLIRPEALIDNVTHRTPQNYFHTGGVVHMYCKETPTPVFVADEFFYPAKVEASNWSNGMWIYSRREKVLALMSAPPSVINEEVIAQQMTMHGLSSAPLILANGTRAMQMSYIAPAINEPHTIR